MKICVFLIICLLSYGCTKQVIYKDYYSFLQYAKNKNTEEHDIESEDNTFCLTKYPRAVVNDIEDQSSYWFCRANKAKIRYTSPSTDQERRFVETFKLLYNEFLQKSYSLRPQNNYENGVSDQ